MKWPDPISTYQDSKRLRLITKSTSESEFWDVARESVLISKDVPTRLLAEYAWFNAGKPFFNVWPIIAPSLCKVNLSIDCDYVAEKLVHIPTAILVRFSSPVNGLRQFLASRSIFRSNDKVLYKGIELYCDAGERSADGGNITWDLSCYLRSGKTVEEEVLDVPSSRLGGLVDNEIQVVSTAFRVLCGICLMIGDESLIEPVILNNDIPKRNNDNYRSLVSKAIRRGVFGWNVGSNIQVSPHFRRPHFGIRWCGHGRHDPRLVPIRGSVINRATAYKVPTGYMADVDRDL